MRILKLLTLTTALLTGTVSASPLIDSVRGAPFYTDPSRTFGQALEYSVTCNPEFQGWDSYVSNDGRDIVRFTCTASDRAMRGYMPRFKRLSSDRGALQEAEIELHFVIGADQRIYPYETRLTVYWDNLKQTIWERGQRDMVFRAYESISGYFASDLELIHNFTRFYNNEKIPLN